MNMKKNSFLFKVAYAWSLDDYGKYVRNMSLCRFFWRIVFSLLIVWPIVVPTLFSVVFVLMVFAYIAGFLFATKPGLDNSSASGFVSYKYWPSIKGFRIYPIYFVLISVLSWLSIVVYKTYMMDHFFAIICKIVGSIVLLAIIIGLVIKFTQRSEPFKLLRDYVKAKKKKVCPIIHFED